MYVLFSARDVDAVKNDVRVLALRLLDISSNGTSSSMYVRIVMHINFLYTHIRTFIIIHICMYVCMHMKIYAIKMKIGA